MAEVRNIVEFTAVLHATSAEIDALVASETDYPVWRQLQEQLHALQRWSVSTAAPGSEPRGAISIGLIAAREIEPTDIPWLDDLATRLHLLNHYWRHWPTGDVGGPARPVSPAWQGARTLGVAAAILAGVALVSTATIRWFARTTAGPAVPFGQTMSIPGAVATLTASLEPYTIRLQHDPERERQEIQLKLSDPTHVRPDRLIPIARHLRASGLQFDVRLLGDDGHRLWFFVDGIGAWDYRLDERLDAADLRRANPTLGDAVPQDGSLDPLLDPAVARVATAARDLWSGEARLYGFDGRLTVTSSDFRRLYVIDPQTLRATVK